LIKNNWRKEDEKEFREFLLSFAKPDKVVWTKNILKTQMPVLAIPSKTLDEIVKYILKGDFMSFLDLKLYSSHEEVVINGNLIMRIKDIALRSEYLEEYFLHVDCWATCDTLKFRISQKDRQIQWQKMLEYSSSSRPFVRRIALIILFAYIRDDEYLPKIYDVIDVLGKDGDYYVEMCAAWLLCELFIKRREETLAYLPNNTLSAFTINKAVQKCRDSFRVSEQDKEYLKRFKK